MKFKFVFCIGRRFNDLYWEVGIHPKVCFVNLALYHWIFTSTYRNIFKRFVEYGNFLLISSLFCNNFNMLKYMSEALEYVHTCIWFCYVHLCFIYEIIVFLELSNEIQIDEFALVYFQLNKKFESYNENQNDPLWFHTKNELITITNPSVK